jgi:hypothetical protein
MTDVALPDVFELYLAAKDEYFQAHVIWRRGDNIGISWTPERRLNPRSESNVTEYHLADRVAKLSTTSRCCKTARSIAGRHHVSR